MAAGFTDIHRDLLERLDGVFWEADPEALRFVLVGPKAESLLGYPDRDVEEIRHAGMSAAGLTG